MSRAVCVGIRPGNRNAIQSGRTISLRAMHWSTIGREELAMVLSVLDSQIDAIGGDRMHGASSRESDITEAAANEQAGRTGHDRQSGSSRVLKKHV